MKIEFIVIKDNSTEEKIKELAGKLDVRTIMQGEPYNKNCLHLEWSSEGLSLVKASMKMRGDFTGMLNRLKPGNLNGEFLVKAAKIKGSTGNQRLVDATAGMGEDSLLLAAAGFKVDMYEYDPVIAAMLKDAMERATKIKELKDIVARMTLHEENSISALGKLEFVPDVILLDPMFPERQKSASVKKKFQLLQQLECPCTDEEELLNASMNIKPKKIIIKRPLKGPFLAGAKPDYSLTGKAIRVDTFINL